MAQVMASKGGLGLTAQDMEASRLVFVSVKDAKPRRKVAVPVPDSLSWQQFLQQVQQKLKLSSIDSIYLASTGERVTSLEALQDIDELQVVEGAVPGSTNGAYAANGSAYARDNGGHVNISLAPSGSQLESKHPVAAADTGATANDMDVDGDADAKYIKRNNMLRRTLQSMFPAAFAPTLPVTTKDVAKDAGATPHDATRSGRRRSTRGKTRSGGRGRLIALVLLVVSAMLMMLYVFKRTALPDVRA